MRKVKMLPVMTMQNDTITMINKSGLCRKKPFDTKDIMRVVFTAK